MDAHHTKKGTNEHGPHRVVQRGKRNRRKCARRSAIHRWRGHVEVLGVRELRLKKGHSTYTRALEFEHLRSALGLERSGSSTANISKEIRFSEYYSGLVTDKTPDWFKDEVRAVLTKLR